MLMLTVDTDVYINADTDVVNTNVAVFIFTGVVVVFGVILKLLLMLMSLLPQMLKLMPCIVMCHLDHSTVRPGTAYSQFAGPFHRELRTQPYTKWYTLSVNDPTSPTQLNHASNVARNCYASPGALMLTWR
jgi:hypothetical protein